MFKVVMKYPDGTTDEFDDLFDTREDAQAFGMEQCDNFDAGGEVLNMSNPGDYPLDEDDEEVDFEIIEVDA